MKPKAHSVKTKVSFKITDIVNQKLAAKYRKKNNKYKKILIADDDYAIIDVLTLMLEDIGYKVAASAEGLSVQDVNKIKPDLILLDILMSGISGHIICKQLKAEPSTKHIPVIMISANKHAAEIAKEACADDFITKPFEMPYLLQKVAKYITK